MKIFSILLIVIFLSLNIAFAEDRQDNDSTKIFINLEEIKELMPDIYNVSVTVNVTTLKEVDAINILGSVDKAIRSLNLNYKGGKYSVYKKCWWEKGKEKCSGYTGNVYYTFELNEPKEQNRILETLTEFQEKYGDKVSINVSTPGWNVSKKILKKAEEELKFEVIDSANSFAKKVGEKLNKKCFLSEINYSTTKRPSPVYPMLKSAAPEATIEIEAPTPAKEEKTISVNASVKIICK